MFGETSVYDSANRRIKKTAGSTTTCSVWEGAQVVAEYNNAAAPGSPNTEYIFTGGRMLAEERSGSGTTRFFHQDRLSTRLTTNSAGAVLGTQSHLPFGEQLSESSEQQKWKFTTYERDSETGDDYAINRGSWPTLGRFRQADKLAGGITDPQSLNRYAYALNDPPNVADPSGNAPGPSLFGSYFLDASLRQYGLFIDGFEVQPGQAGLFFGLLSSGAGVIGPIGASAFLGEGGVTYLSLNTGRGYLPDGTLHLGVTDVRVIEGPQYEAVDAIYHIAFEALGDAERLILNNRKCRRLFGNTNLTRLFRRTGLSVGQTPAADVESGIRNGKPYVKVNASSNVFSPREDVAQAVTRNLNSFFGANLNISEWRSAVMIHELLHAAGFASGDRDTGVNNVKRLGGGTLVNSGSFGVTAAVLRDCFNIIGLDRFFK